MGYYPPTSPGGYGGYGGAPPPPTHLVWAILTTIFCCLPAGIVSIVFAAQVNSKWMSGDHAGAISASRNARIWAIVSAAVTAVLVVIYLLFVLVIASSSSTT
ncbi:CD225/dispanin family protein [Actinomadura roseirufa]|uniref:CD225/dispanin family protein n=1 Tax=Actinomadura roseirufa TaxID=2094049 RepID=UPI001A9561C8|nr:CD225/dispanin family protein [Actinomadura roseirufa]